jgi:Holliday junction resolvase RusA-like endonuclease
MDAGIQIASQISRMATSDRPVAEGTNVEGIDYPVAITLTFYHGDQVRRDSDNQAASIMDLLQDAKVLADDRWQIVRILTIYNHYEKGDARCLIEINKL